MAPVFDTPLFSGDQSIERVLKAELPVLLVFFNKPLHQSLEQALRTLAKQHAGKMLIVQLESNDNPETIRRFMIRALPALTTWKNGQVYSQAEEIIANDLEQHANYLLGKGPQPAANAQPQAAGANPTRTSSNGRPSTAQAAGSTGSGGRPVTVTDASFDQEVMRSPLPVVVDFWAPWCGPCRMVAPTLDKLASEWTGKVKIAKVNVDENPRVSGQFGIQSIPTMIVVINGKIVERWAGALPEPALRSRLSAAIR